MRSYDKRARSVAQERNKWNNWRFPLCGLPWRSTHLRRKLNRITWSFYCKKSDVTGRAWYVSSNIVAINKQRGIWKVSFEGEAAFDDKVSKLCALSLCLYLRNIVAFHTQFVSPTYALAPRTSRYEMSLWRTKFGYWIISFIWRIKTHRLSENANTFPGLSLCKPVVCKGKGRECVSVLWFAKGKAGKCVSVLWEPL